MNWKHFLSVFIRVLEVVSDILYYVDHQFFGGVDNE